MASMCFGFSHEERQLWLDKGAELRAVILKLRMATWFCSSTQATYHPVYTDSLQKVSTLGKAVLCEAKKLQAVSCNGLVLKRSLIRGSVSVGNLACTIISSRITQVCLCSSKNVTVKRAKIYQLKVLPSRGRQVVKIQNATIGRLVIESASYGSNVTQIDGSFVYESSNKKFKLVVKSSLVKEIVVRNSSYNLEIPFCRRLSYGNPEQLMPNNIPQVPYANSKKLLEAAII